MDGTGFFVKRKENKYLITNWHNVTAKNPNTGDFINYAIEPDLLKVQIYKNQEILEPADFEIPLKDNQGNPVWLEHPTEGGKIDVVAIPVEIPDDKLVMFIEECIEPYNEDTISSVKDDVYVLGFPFGLSIASIFPIWKRASIASEPIVDIDNLPKMYIDTASRPGMSGSPVIYKKKRGIAISDRKPDLPGAKLGRHYMKMIGIYSGRIGTDDEKKVQLGIVWKYDVIDQIIK